MVTAELGVFHYVTLGDLLDSSKNRSPPKLDPPSGSRARTPREARLSPTHSAKAVKEQEAWRTLCLNLALGFWAPVPGKRSYASQESQSFIITPRSNHIISVVIT